MGNVNGVVDFFLVGWLELSSVTTLGLINLGVVVLTGWDFEVDVSIRVSLVWKLDVDVGVLGFVFLRSALVVNVDLFSAARTVTILLTSYMDFFRAKLLGSWRKVGRDGIIVPSDARWEVDFTLDVCRFGDFGSLDFGVVLVGRREDAKRDGNSGVKVQIDDLDVQRTLLECLSEIERKTRRGLLLLWGEEERGGKKALGRRFLTRLSIEVARVDG